MRRWWSNFITWPDGLLRRLTLRLSDDLNTATFAVADRGDQGFVESRSCSANYDQYGAGSGERSSHSSGRYVFAVDYKNMQPVYARIEVEGDAHSASTVSVSHDHPPDQHSLDVITGQTQYDPSVYREYLVYDTNGAETARFPIFSDTFEGYSVSWTAGATTPTYNRIIKRQSTANEITYFLDLRADQYAYYHLTLKDDDEIATSTETFVQDGDEGSRFEQAGDSRTLHTHTLPQFVSNSSVYARTFEIRCGGPSPAQSYRYGTSNLGSWSYFDNALGNAAIDYRDHLAHSQQVLAESGYSRVGTANTLSPNANLESVIPGAPPPGGAAYYLIDVVR